KKKKSKSQPAMPAKPAVHALVSDKNVFALSALLIFLFAFLLYSNTLRHEFVMDDGAVIRDNVTVQKGLTGITELFRQSSVYGSTKQNYGSYRPLTLSLFAVEIELFGNNPSAFHIVHVLLYASLCVVIFYLLSKLLNHYHPWLPFVSALLFTAHPVHTDVAANIKSADEILSLLFCSLTLMGAAGYAETSKIKYAAGLWLIYLAALFSKENAATFLVLVPLALFFFTRATRKKIATVAVIQFSCFAIYLFARKAVLDPVTPPGPIVDNTLIGAGSLAERYATISIFFLKYLKLLFLPHPLTWDYGYNQIPLTSFNNPLAIVSLLIHLGMGIYALYIFIRMICSRKKDSLLQTSHLMAFCILFYFIAFSASSNIFFLIASTVAERFLFTPSLAFCIALAGLILKVSGNEMNFKTPFFYVKMLPLLVILVLYSLKTYSRNKDWKDELTLFRTGAETSPHSYRANQNYGWVSLIAGEKESDPQKKKQYFETAVTHYRKAIAIYNQRASDWFNYGVACGYLGKTDEAVKAYERAIALDPRDYKAAYNLAAINYNKKDFANSLKYFLLSYRADSTRPADIAFKVGLSYHQLNDLPNAVKFYENFFRRNPRNTDVINNLSIAYAGLNDTAKANRYMKLLEKTR
ncbi:MAG TPA: tetratricopeptide repeat protein, partial [Chitinophagales bacterium]|nr:tetratricopeptide repeat protein [Chitinophagales bacterium]